MIFPSILKGKGNAEIPCLPILCWPFIMILILQNLTWKILHASICLHFINQQGKDILKTKELPSGHHKAVKCVVCPVIAKGPYAFPTCVVPPRDATP